MKYYTHVATSVAASLAIMQVTDSKLALPTLAGIVVGSLLPDIDEPRSYVGSRSLGTANVVKGIFGHRGFTHSILAFLFMLFPLYWMLHIQSYVVAWDSLFHYEQVQNELTGFKHILFLGWYGIAFGYLLHILEDMCSVSGVPLFYPLNKKIKIPIYRTGSAVEKLIFLVAVGYIIYFAKDMILV